MFAVFCSIDHLEKFTNYLNSKHKNIKFSHEKESNNSQPFLDILISRSKTGFKTSIYHKPTFSGVYSNFNSFIYNQYKIGLAFTLLFQTFSIVSVNCCHVWAGVPSCYLALLNKPQRQICRIVGPSLAASPEPLVHHRNVARLSLFYRYYFGRFLTQHAQLVLLPYFQGRSTRYSDGLGYSRKKQTAGLRTWNSQEY